MKTKIITFAIAALVCMAAFAHAAEMEAPKQVLFKNVNIFDGTSEKLAMGQDVLVEGNLIKKVAKGIKTSGAEVIDGGGRTLMPGLIEAHAHLSLHGDLFQIRNEMNWMYVGAKLIKLSTKVI